GPRRRGCGSTVLRTSWPRATSTVGRSVFSPASTSSTRACRLATRLSSASTSSTSRSGTADLASIPAVMDFGFTLKPDHSLERIASLTRLAESAGFTYGWLFDSHVLWKEPYVLLTLMAQNTKRMRLGTCV